MTEVSAQFGLWFKIGFIIQCASILFTLFQIGYYFTQSQHYSAPTNLVGCISCCGGIALFIWGIIIRFGDTGRACSGDFYDGPGQPEPYLWSQGYFLKIYLIIILTAILIAVCIGCICGICLASSNGSATINGQDYSFRSLRQRRY